MSSNVTDNEISAWPGILTYQTDWISLSTGNKDAASSEKLFEIVINHNLNQVDQQDTRVTSQSQSLLDLVFLSGAMDVFSVTVEEGISDHKLISVEILCGTKRRKQPFVRVPVSDYGWADDTSILDFWKLHLMISS